MNSTLFNAGLTKAQVAAFDMAGEFLVVVHGGTDEAAQAHEILEGTAHTHLQAHGTLTSDARGPDLSRTRL